MIAYLLLICFVTVATIIVAITERRSHVAQRLYIRECVSRHAERMMLLRYDMTRYERGARNVGLHTSGLRKGDRLLL